MDAFIEILKYVFPAALVLLMAYLMLSNFVDNEESRRNYYMKKDLQKKALPLRLQAYERLCLFLERITPSTLIQGHSTKGKSAAQYRTELTNAIRQEYEYNLTQQIYISDEAWKHVVNAKGQTISFINKLTADLPEEATAFDLSKALLETSIKGEIFPTKAAIMLLKHEAARNF